MYEFEACRDLRHRWSREFTFELEGQELRRLIPCDDCGTIRVERYAVRRGRVTTYLGTRMRYPKGYLVKGGYDKQGLRASVMKMGLFLLTHEPKKEV